MFRYGVWSPPQDIWDVVLSYLGYEFHLVNRTIKNWNLYTELHDALEPRTLIRVQNEFTLEFKVNVLKHILGSRIRTGEITMSGIDVLFRYDRLNGR